MTTYNSTQNLSDIGVNNSVKAPLNLLENESISSSEPPNNRNQILVEQIIYMTPMMTDYHQFVGDCFLTHPVLDDLSFSTEAIQLDIDKRLKNILKLATNH
ncbi:hypothetical protein DM558_04580 [Entomomonas moraniae]|uniref:Uncharacterized protein n=1 Tax=Entomomonas moraniae TaxID=2213226 RepID=A0A3S9XCH2_9GAMM|nr:hypothetical protein [Entomomonas moraniae]AZS50095.1 hypothetical protein DM558_04580 [Entomomonas moraniae]